MTSIISRLLVSNEPTIRYKVRINVLGEDVHSPGIADLPQEIKASPRVRALLVNRLPDGRIEPLRHVYQKWTGAHWVLASLADIGYPAGDEGLRPALEQLFAAWLHPDMIRAYVETRTLPRWATPGVPIIDGRARRRRPRRGRLPFTPSLSAAA